MAAKQLFEYAVIKQEKVNKDGEVVEEATVLVPPTTVLATGDAQVGLIAAKQIPEEEMTNVDRIEVKIRPF